MTKFHVCSYCSYYLWIVAQVHSNPQSFAQPLALKGDSLLRLQVTSCDVPVGLCQQVTFLTAMVFRPGQWHRDSGNFHSVLAIMNGACIGHLNPPWHSGYHLFLTTFIVVCSGKTT